MQVVAIAGDYADRVAGLWGTQRVVTVVNARSDSGHFLCAERLYRRLKREAYHSGRLSPSFLCARS